MKNLGYKIATSTAVIGLLTVMTASSAFAAVSVKVKDNGANSKNKVKVGQLSASVVAQGNQQTVVNGVTAKSKTGSNSANKNTNGDVSVDTGKATTTVGITVGGGTNTATAPDCGCEQGDVDVVVSGNGNGSTNKVKVWEGNFSLVLQGNSSTVVNDVYASSNTGNNEANQNTGGTVGVTTGNAETGVVIDVSGGTNTLN